MIIKEMIPQNNINDYNNLLEAFISIWNDPENLKYLSLTMKPFQEETISYWLSNHLDQGGQYFVVQEDQGEILGISAVKINNIEGFELIGLGVRPKAKRAGIGSSLILHAINLANDLRYKAVDGSLFADNFIMMRILLQFKFMPVQIKHHARTDGTDLVCMKKYL